MRFVKGGVSRALRTLRAAASPAEDRVVPLSPQMVAAVCGGLTAAPSGCVWTEAPPSTSGRVGDGGASGAALTASGAGP